MIAKKKKKENLLQKQKRSERNIMKKIKLHDMDIQSNTTKREDKTRKRSSSYNNSTLAKKIIRNMNK